MLNKPTFKLKDRYIDNKMLKSNSSIATGNRQRNELGHNNQYYHKQQQQQQQAMSRSSSKSSIENSDDSGIYFLSISNFRSFLALICFLEMSFLPQL